MTIPIASMNHGNDDDAVEDPKNFQYYTAGDGEEEDPRPGSIDKNNNNNYNEDGDGFAGNFVSEEDDDRVRHWKQSPYAVGLVDIDWKPKNRSNHEQQSSRQCCTLISSMCCRHAGRVGNMVVLGSSSNSDESSSSPPSRRRMMIVLGPYWPVMMFVTYPLIVGISCVTAVRKIATGRLRAWLAVAWCLGTVLLLAALAAVACRNPGILERRSADVPGDDADAWIWNDQALTFRPRHAKYDSECAVVVEHFDHTCPWTGTAIGKNNIRAFRCFLFLIIVMLLFNVMLNLVPTIALS